MFSSASGWKDGRNCWSITHNAQQGIEHLEAGGELPEAFEAIRNEMLTKQKEENVRMAGIRRPLFRPRSVRFSEMSVDYVFEIPVAVARELTGYQHDRQIPGLTGQAFEVLARTRPERPTQESRPSIWKRLFRV